MATPTLLQILDRVGLLIGGTQPNAAQSPHFYSGQQVGDGSGVAGLNGCYSIPEDVLSVEPPVALLFPEGFDAQGLQRPGQLTQGNEDNEDRIHIWLMLWRADLATQYALMVAYRDSIPALFRQHMQLSQLGGAGTITDAFIVHGHTGTIVWAGQSYIGWEFVLRIRQLYSVTYQDI